MKRRMKSMVGLALAAVMVCSPVFSVKADTEDEIEAAEQKADELESQKEAAESEKAELSERLDTIIAEMKDTQEKLLAKEEEVEQVENELIQARIDAENQYESMKVRIKFMYEGGNTQLIEMLFESESMGDFLNKAEYISQISEYDRNELIRYQDTVKREEEKEARVQAEYDELSDLQEQLVNQQAEVEDLIESNAAQIADIQSQIDENQETLQELKEKAAEAERIRKEQLAAAQAQAAQASGNSGGSSGTQSSGGGGGSSVSKPSSGNVVSGNGYFTHPCPGYTYQSSYFGEIRVFETGGHKGHDYAAPTGTPTYAAAAGTVTIAGYSPSAGNWVVINHGNGLTTKYMHHSALCVSAGQHVEKGQQIGYVGSTGQSTGPHLHFQVEEYGVAVNPDKYL